MTGKVWDEITYPFLNNGCTVVQFLDQAITVHLQLPWSVNYHMISDHIISGVKSKRLALQNITLSDFIMINMYITIAEEIWDTAIRSKHVFLSFTSFCDERKRG